MKTNANRLTSAYDVYETLVEILHENFDGKEKKSYKNRGKSLFRKISEFRICENLEIPMHFCLCQEEENLQDFNSEFIRNATEKILETILKNLEPHFKKCAKLSLKKILSAQKLKTNSLVLFNSRFKYEKFVQDREVSEVFEFFRIIFETSPGFGIFEATVQKNVKKDGEFSVNLQDISRINSYGHSGDCISMVEGRKFEKFCHCLK